MSLYNLRAVYIGWDKREADAFAVARRTVRSNITRNIPIHGLILSHLQDEGLYNRPIEMRPSAADRSVMWDVISDAPMSTEHANARFLIPHIAQNGFVLFMDGDMLVRGNLQKAMNGVDTSKAVYCVKHNHNPHHESKMDGQIQTRYNRKNWSSFMIFNCDHPSNKALTPELVNSLPGRDLHRFCWLKDEEIGELSPEWNFLVGHTDKSINPKVVHFTDGVPSMAGYESVPYADEWRRELLAWAS